MRAHELLGVPPRPTLGELDAARRRMILATHPDRHPNDPQAEARFRAVEEAYLELRCSITGEPRTPGLLAMLAASARQVLGALADECVTIAAEVAADEIREQLRDTWLGNLLRRLVP